MISICNESPLYFTWPVVCVAGVTDPERDAQFHPSGRAERPWGWVTSHAGRGAGPCRALRSGVDATAQGHGGGPYEGRLRGERRRRAAPAEIGGLMTPHRRGSTVASAHRSRSAAFCCGIALRVWWGGLDSGRHTYCKILHSMI